MKLFIALLMFLGSTVEAQAAPIKTTGGNLSFTAIGKPGFLKIRGESKQAGPSGTVEFGEAGLTGSFAFELSTLDTGIGMRNEHMKEKYLEVGKFPKAELVLQPLKIAPTELASDFTREFTGTLTLHGVSKEVSGKFKWQAERREVSAQFEVKVVDFNIDIPKYMGVTVSEKVEINVAVQLAK